MNRWLLRFHVILALGGGYAGLLVAIDGLAHLSQSSRFKICIVVSLFVFYSFGIIGGLILNESGRRWPLLLYYLFQIPIFQNSRVTFELWSAADLSVVASEHGFQYPHGFGSSVDFFVNSLPDPHYEPYIGANLFALVVAGSLFVERGRSRRKTARHKSLPTTAGSSRHPSGVSLARQFSSIMKSIQKWIPDDSPVSVLGRVPQFVGSLRLLVSRPRVFVRVKYGKQPTVLSARDFVFWAVALSILISVLANHLPDTDKRWPGGLQPLFRAEHERIERSQATRTETAKDATSSPGYFGTFLFQHVTTHRLSTNGGSSGDTEVENDQREVGEGLDPRHTGLDIFFVKGRHGEADYTFGVSRGSMGLEYEVLSQVGNTLDVLAGTVATFGFGAGTEDQDLHGSSLEFIQCGFFRVVFSGLGDDFFASAFSGSVILLIFAFVVGVSLCIPAKLLSRRVPWQRVVSWVAIWASTAILINISADAASRLVANVLDLYGYSYFFTFAAIMMISVIVVVRTVVSSTAELFRLSVIKAFGLWGAAMFVASFLAPVVLIPCVFCVGWLNTISTWFAS